MFSLYLNYFFPFQVFLSTPKSKTKKERKQTLSFEQHVFVSTFIKKHMDGRFNWFVTINACQLYHTE